MKVKKNKIKMKSLRRKKNLAFSSYSRLFKAQVSLKERPHATNCDDGILAGSGGTVPKNPSTVNRKWEKMESIPEISPWTYVSVSCLTMED